METGASSSLAFRKRRANAEMSLQITSMADIFTILLVFLLKSYAASSTNIVPNRQLRLPIARTETMPREAVRVEIAQDVVQVDSEPVARLNSFHFASGEVQSNGASASVEAALKVKRKRQQLIAQSNSEVKVDNKILIVSDQDTPYTTLKPVLAAAAYEGFTDFQLVVAKKE